MLFDLENGEPIINPECLWVPGFKEVWEQDVDVHKRMAHRKLLYVYHVVNPNSAYSGLEEDERAEIVGKEYLEKGDRDKVLKTAVDAYKKFIFDFDISIEFMESVKSGLKKIMNSIKTANIDITKAPSYNAFVSAMKQGEALLGSYQKLSAKVRDGYKEEVHFKGGGKVSLHEQLIGNS